MCVGRPAYYSLFGLIVVSILSVLVNTFISSLHPHPEDKVHPITEVGVVAAGSESGRGGGLGSESSEVPPVARLLINTPVKASSVAPFQSSASSASSRAALSPPSLAPASSQASSPYASSPPAHYQTPTAAQPSLNSRSSDSRR